jgi:hypothetical protein
VVKIPLVIDLEDALTHIHTLSICHCRAGHTVAKWCTAVVEGWIISATASCMNGGTLCLSIPDTVMGEAVIDLWDVWRVRRAHACHTDKGLHIAFVEEVPWIGKLDNTIIKEYSRCKEILHGGLTSNNASRSSCSLSWAKWPAEGQI